MRIRPAHPSLKFISPPSQHAPVRLKAAMCVLQAFGALDAEPIGPTDPETVKADRRHAEAVRRQSDFLDELGPC